jgi:carbohydrate diacid regulator
MLSGTLAQQIAGETTEAIGYNVIITDAEGMVIGSGDTSRVGSFHEASIEVMRTRESAWHNPEEARALRGVRPGITLPLVIGDEAVGTVGITGSPRQVRRFGLVVRRQTEILLEESALVRSRLMRERALEDLVNEVAAFDPELVEPELVVSSAAELGFQLLLPRCVLLFDVDGAATGPELLRVLRSVFHQHEDIVARRSAGRCAILAPVDARSVRNVESEARRAIRMAREALNLRLRVAISPPADTVEKLRDCCSDAAEALWLGARVQPADSVLRVADLRAQQALAAIGHRVRGRLVEQELGGLRSAADWLQLRATVVQWCESGFNQVAAAKALNIHRNTLLYRLDKIERLVGRSWRDHRAMLSLYIACLADQLGPPE